MWFPRPCFLLNTWSFSSLVCYLPFRGLCPVLCGSLASTSSLVLYFVTSLVSTAENVFIIKNYSTGKPRMFRHTRQFH